MVSLRCTGLLLALSLCALSAATANPSVSVDIDVQETIIFGEVSVSFRADALPQRQGDYLGIHPTSADPAAKPWASYPTQGLAQGTIVVNMPSPSGVFEIRYHSNQTSAAAVMGVSQPITVRRSYYDLQVQPTVVDPTTTSQWTATWSAPPFAGSEDWLGLYAVGAPAGEGAPSLWWQFTGQGRTGSLSVPLPNGPGFDPARGGVLEVRYFQNRGYNRVSHSAPLLVVPPSAYTGAYAMVLNTHDIVQGGALVIGFVAPPQSSATDWIGIFPIGAGDRQFTTYGFTGGRTSGTVALVAPTTAGSYEVRYYTKDTYIMAARGPSFSVHGRRTQCLPPSAPPQSNVKHVIVIVPENQVFDGYFGNFCTGRAGSDPQCTVGAGCCERAPLSINNTLPTLLDDNENYAFNPNHEQDCETAEMNNREMSGYISGAWCSRPRNYAVAAKGGDLAIYQQYAAQYTLADRYFQAASGASSENDMYLARARYVFPDNSVIPDAIGQDCYGNSTVRGSFLEPTVADLLSDCGVNWANYFQGYAAVVANQSVGCYPEYYDPSDNPFEYYVSLRDDPHHMKDYLQFFQDVNSGQLPAVSWMKALGMYCEHPGLSSITAGENFTKSVIDAINASPRYRDNTVVLIAHDESGGYFDHISPPPDDNVDALPYGPRLPFLALGAITNPSGVSHVIMEHSSIVSFVEWNFLGRTGQLNTRDATANGLGSLFDPSKTGGFIPGATSGGQFFEPEHPSGSGLSTAAVVGIIVGVVAAVVAIGVAVHWHRSKKARDYKLMRDTAIEHTADVTGGRGGAFMSE